ncbi:glycosyltransferase family 2 protein [Vibrio jasicida]|uniref:glycosyltransferase family 2 protein n=1 Tax=Vibrio jasicida TaxID=766224 RepID=UPI000CE41371|nr:glycosyltransferase family 2 protein [Vibrio jasicida]
MPPSLSVVIPLYNKEKFILRAIESIKAQTFKVKEIIVVDDGSQDMGARLVKQYHPDVTLIQQCNQGVSVARNIGIDAATSNHVAFLDADDYWLPRFAEKITLLIKSSPNAVMYCTHYAFNTGLDVRPALMRAIPKLGGKINDLFASCLNADLPITASSVCIKRSKLMEIGGFPVGMKMGEDQVVWAKIACLGKVMYDPEICVHYDLSIEGSACDINKVYEPAPQLSVYQNMLEQGQVPEYLKGSLKKLMHYTVLSCVKNNLLAGQRFEARRLLLTHPCLIYDRYRIGALIASCLPVGLFNLFLRLVRGNR